MEFVELVTKNLGLHEQQAKGAAGLFFSLAKQSMTAGDFSKLVHHVPNIDELIEALPRTTVKTDTLRGLGSALESQGRALGNLASLERGLSKLGLDAGKTRRFISLLRTYLRNKGGEETGILLERTLR